jgi:hypothetical protein
MKLDYVVTAVNDNPIYEEFIPIWIKTWNKLYPEVKARIIMVAEKIPSKYLEYTEQIILFKPISGVLTSFTSQIIRLLYPCLLDCEGGVMISDADMLPMNRIYYIQPIQMIDDDKFVYMRENICFNNSEIAMCYNVAVPKVWKEIFGIKSVEDITNTIKHISDTNLIQEGHGNIGWNIDQKFLYQKVMMWHYQTNRLIRLKESDTKFNRLDRNTFNLSDVLKKQISDGVYTDYHCLRPMSVYSDINYEIYNLL